MTEDKENPASVLKGITVSGGGWMLGEKSIVGITNIQGRIHSVA